MTNIAFKEQIKIKEIEIICDKNTSLNTIELFLEDNFYLPEYYGHGEDEKAIFILGVVELLQNSIRASTEKDVDHPITCKFKYKYKEVAIEIINGAGGFDFGKIPFKLDTFIKASDLPLEEYHKNTSRGGLGLFLASKTFKDFSINFFDENGEISDFQEGKTKGTKIVMSIGRVKNDR